MNPENVSRLSQSEPNNVFRLSQSAPNNVSRLSQSDPNNVFRLSQSDPKKTPEPQIPSPPPFAPLNKSAPITKTRRILPHWSQEGCTYFATFRLADSVAAPVWRKWQQQRAAWLNMHPKPWDQTTQKDYNTKFPAQMELWLDAGYGSCALKNPALREIATTSMHHFDGHRFTLGDYIIMPNHVHVLVTPHPGHTLASILTGWKRVSGHKIISLIGNPKPFWMTEDFDHAIRSERQLKHFKNYIAQNPIKAGLPTGSWTHWKSLC
jgi:REP element-mobilizing transposase RayT